MKFKPEDFAGYLSIESPLDNPLEKLAIIANAKLNEMLDRAPTITFIDEGDMGCNLHGPKCLHTHEAKIVCITPLKRSEDEE